MKLAIIVGVLLVLARPADACGEWSMTDNERGTNISFLINSGRITKNGKNVGAIYLDDESKHGLRVVAKRKVIFDFKGNALRKRGKTVATVDGNTISFGRRKYTIELTDPHVVHEVMLAFKLAVKRGDQLIVESDEASSLCAGLDRAMTDAEKEEEVRRRVFYYLAWRELGTT